MRSPLSRNVFPRSSSSHAATSVSGPRWYTFMRIGIAAVNVSKPLDELILILARRVHVALLGPPLQPLVHLHLRDPALPREAHDVLVVRSPGGTLLGELADDVAEHDDLVPLGLADPDLDDVDVEAALLARDAAHPVLRDPDRPLRVLRVDALAQPGAGARFREADDRLELPWGDGHRGPRGFPRLTDLEVLRLDCLHG